MMLLGTYRGFELNIRFDSFKMSIRPYSGQS